MYIGTNHKYHSIASSNLYNRVYGYSNAEFEIKTKQHPIEELKKTSVEIIPGSKSGGKNIPKNNQDYFLEKKKFQKIIQIIFLEKKNPKKYSRLIF